VEKRRAGKQPDAEVHQEHTPVAIDPAANEWFDREGDKTRYANEKARVRFLSAEMFDIERQCRKEKEKAEKIT